MSTSYVEYGGKGFWSWDGYLEDALASSLTALEREMSPTGSKPLGDTGPNRRPVSSWAVFIQTSTSS